MQVLEGKDGWLFLDNDTNGSAGIFTGDIPVTTKMIETWAKFSRKFKSEMDARGISGCIVISPSKEDVFPEFHPLQAASLPLIDIVSASIFATGTAVSCPVRKLRQEPKSYYKTDTHWSDLGAWICALDIFRILDIPNPEIEALFDDVELMGDLGSKMTPTRKSVKATWRSNSTSTHLSFDNKIMRTGDIKVYENEAPKVDKSLLVFGGSSSKNLVDIFSSIFNKVTLINTPLHMPIVEIIDQEKPDIVICQTNARYLRRPPKIFGAMKDSPIGELKVEELPKGWMT